jgi:hypothetical protein
VPGSDSLATGIYVCTLKHTYQEEVVACLRRKCIKGSRDLGVVVPGLPRDEGIRQCGGSDGKSANGAEEKHSGWRTIRTFLPSVLPLNAL